MSSVTLRPYRLYLELLAREDEALLVCDDARCGMNHGLDAAAQVAIESKR